MTITPLANGPLDPLRRFLDRLGASATTFRYFQSRPIEIVRGHIVTLLGYDAAGEPIAYGHLEREADIVWLGLAIAEGHTGRGLGSKMIDALLAAGRDAGVAHIRLSVDRDNRPAIRLYETHGFLSITQDERRIFMEWSFDRPAAAKTTAPAIVSES